MGVINTYVIDLFAGGGGTTTGIFESKTNIKVIACINHDENAIKSHKANYPDCLHFIEDIRTIDLTPILDLIKELRTKEPNCKIAIWASLECVNFSIAKGGQPKDNDSRTLAEHLIESLDENNILKDRYIPLINPDFVWIENVKEFMSWGPLDEKGKPVSMSKGIDYLKWIDKIKSFGYHYDYKILNSADFGAYTSRIRYFAQFSKDPNLIAFPEPTHSKTIYSKNELFENEMKPWKAVKEVLDLKDEGLSIFERKKPLVDKTLNVILKGIIKAIKDKEKTFLYKYYGNGDNLNSVNSPAGTLTTKDRFAKIQLIFNQYKTGYNSEITTPLNTITTTPKSNLLTFIFNPSHGGHTTSIEKPCPTVIARQDKAPLYLIKAIMKEYEIVDVKMRMLKIDELKVIQGFPKKYILLGNQAQQKKMIGNSVEINVGIALFKAIDNKINNYERN